MTSGNSEQTFSYPLPVPAGPPKLPPAIRIAPPAHQSVPSEQLAMIPNRPVSMANARALLATAPGIVFMDELKGEVPQPLHY